MSTKKWLAVVITLVVVLGAFVLNQQIFSNPDNLNQVLNTSEETGGASATVDALQITDSVVGTGAEAVNGKMITVHYTGTLVDGSKFDSSYDHGAPFEFNLGSGGVIQGWEQGILGMKVGGKRHLVIPADLAYGARALTGPDGTVLIPANSVLVFDVELLGVK